MEDMSIEQLEPGKLCSRNHRDTERTTIWVTPKARKELEWLLEFYYRVLGKQPVSTSLVVRRSLEICQNRIQTLLQQGNLEAVLREGELIKKTR